jgi:hypothetical protein
MFNAKKKAALAAGMRNMRVVLTLINMGVEAAAGDLDAYMRLHPKVMAMAAMELRVYTRFHALACDCYR